MQIEHHDLVHEFPEFKEKIHQLKMDNHHFARLFETYHTLNNEIEQAEKNDLPITDEHAETLKKQRLELKDQLYQILTSA
ncbi:MAG TPA: YdcH family protein [Halothiobacillus sp.]|nr:YdcH family protein [Halothiobacillus sp.]